MIKPWNLFVQGRKGKAGRMGTTTIQVTTRIGQHSEGEATRYAFGDDPIGVLEVD
jgi:succinyl-CoA synthetase alpha subunit